MTALSWAFTAIFFSLATARIGAVTVNRTRLAMAVLLLGAVHWVTQGSPLPLQASSKAWLWLGLSGLVGLTLGDTFLFQALADLGPRKAMLVMSSWPIFSALLGYLFLGEGLRPLELLGILATLGGIAWVVAERGGVPAALSRPEHAARGVLCAFGGAVCQAVGIVAAKQGLSGGLSPLSGTLIRMVVAAVSLWAVTALVGNVGKSLGRLRDRKALLFTACGAVTGPFVGVWLSLVAVDNAKVGVASALMALVPVLLLPLTRLVLKERVSPRALWGTLAAFLGVVLLFVEN